MTRHASAGAALASTRDETSSARDDTPSTIWSSGRRGTSGRAGATKSSRARLVAATLAALVSGAAADLRASRPLSVPAGARTSISNAVPRVTPKHPAPSGAPAHSADFLAWATRHGKLSEYCPGSAPPARNPCTARPCGARTRATSRRTTAPAARSCARDSRASPTSPSRSSPTITPPIPPRWSKKTRRGNARDAASRPPSPTSPPRPNTEHRTPNTAHATTTTTTETRSNRRPSANRNRHPPKGTTPRAPPCRSRKRRTSPPRAANLFPATRTPEASSVASSPRSARPVV